MVNIDLKRKKMFEKILLKNTGDKYSIENLYKDNNNRKRAVVSHYKNGKKLHDFDRSEQTIRHMKKCPVCSNHIMSGTKSTQDDFIKLINKKYANEYGGYLTTKEDYTNGYTPLTFIHHMEDGSKHEFIKTYTLWDRLTHKCPICAKKKIDLNRKCKKEHGTQFKESSKTEESIKRHKELIKKYEKIMFDNSGIHFLIVGNVGNNPRKFTIQHLLSNGTKHNFTRTRGNLERLKICPICNHGKGDKISEELFQSMLKDSWKKADIGKVIPLEKYKGINKKMKFEHVMEDGSKHIFFKVAKDILNNFQGCPVCVKNKRMDRDAFIEELKNTTGNMYSLVGEYNGRVKKLKLIHNYKGGHIFVTTPYDFLIRKRRCPICSASTGELLVIEWYHQHGMEVNTDYLWQVRFNNLTDKLKLSYDFEIIKGNKRYLIEVQGEQHYRPVSIYGGEKQFEIQQSHDRIKREYAYDNGYILIEIPYYDIKSNLTKYLADTVSF